MSATDNLGPHLLGRKPSTPDTRDYKLSRFLTDDPLVGELAKLEAAYFESKALKRWAKEITSRVIALTPPAPAPTPDPTPTPDPPTPDPAPIPDPTPTPPAPTPDPTPAPTPDPTPVPGTTEVDWANTNTLDQGQTGHCVGFGWADWGNTLPIADSYADADGHKIYYEAKVIDGEPLAEDGSTVRSGAKAMQNRKRLSAYAFAESLADVRAWVRTKGPVVFGTEWTNAMFNPDGNGYISPSDGVADASQIAGGHCFLCVADIPEEDAMMFLNSWGDSWGLGGYFKMKTADVATLLAGIEAQSPGEACAAVELA